MKLENEVRKLQNKLRNEKERLTKELGKVESMMSMFRVASKRGPQKGRKLSMAHRLAIKRGIAAKKAGRKQQ